MEKLEKLKRFLEEKENLKIFITVAETLPEDEIFYLHALFSNFIRIYLGTEDLQYALKTFNAQELKKVILEEDIEEIEKVSNKSIIGYFINIKKLDELESLNKFVENLGMYAFHGFSDNINNSIIKSGLKVDHNQEERSDIENLPIKAKENVGLFKYYFRDSKYRINFATLPRVACIFANYEMPEWFRMFCTGEEYPYSSFLDAGIKEPIEQRILKECAELSLKEKEEVVSFFEKYWNKYVKENVAGIPKIAIVKVNNYLVNQIDKNILTVEDLYKTINNLKFDNLTLDKNIERKNICIISMPEIKKERIDENAQNYLDRNL